MREAPEQIVLVRHDETSDSMRMFVTHWLEVRTATHRLLLKAPDWEQLYAYLQRRCPAAEAKASEGARTAAPISHGVALRHGGVIGQTMT